MQKRIKVLRIINRLNVGGPTYNVTYLSKYLPEEFETKVLSGQKEPFEASSEYILTENGIKAEYIKNMYRPISPFKDYKAYWEIRKIIRKYKPDIVHTHAAKAGMLGRLAAKHEKVPVIIHTFHGNVFDGYFGRVKSYVIRSIEKYLANLSSCVIAISKQQKHDLVHKYKIGSAKKFMVVPLGFDLEQFTIGMDEKRNAFRKEWKIADEEKTVGIIGRLTSIKNHQLFLEAFALVKQKTNLRIKAVIVGDGELKDDLLVSCEKLKLKTIYKSRDEAADADVLFTSWRKDIDAINAGMDIVCLTSLNEGTPVCLIEAIAAGKPVISTRVGGGERLLFEGVRYYRDQGYKVIIITWQFDDAVLFNGSYENRDIILLEEEIVDRSKVFKRAFNRAKSFFRLRKILQELKPEYIISQGEYDVAVTYVVTLFTKLKYIFLIFGQMYQYPHDYSKYALIFKKHLQKIKNSQAGYRDTIPDQMPPTSFVNRISNELISVVRYFAVRKAKKRFAFSRSIQWETKLLFNAEAKILKGAYRTEIFKEEFDTLEVKQRLNIAADKKVVLSFSRLDYKKRIEIIIHSMLHLDQNHVLLIAGTGPDGERLRKIVQKLNLESRVIFLGYVNEADANAVKSSADVVVSMDIGDFDISPFEALALGSKAIVPNEFDIDDELKEFKNLYQVPADEFALAKKIEEATLSKAEKAQEFMGRYTWENYFSKILSS